MFLPSNGQPQNPLASDARSGYRFSHTFDFLKERAHIVDSFRVPAGEPRRFYYLWKRSVPGASELMEAESIGRVKE
jgi:hypothetical protein